MQYLIKAKSVDDIVDVGTFEEVDHAVDNCRVTLRGECQVGHEQSYVGDTGRVRLGKYICLVG